MTSLAAPPAPPPAAPLAEAAAAAAPAPAVRALRAATVAATLALMALCLAWELWLAPTGRGTLALKVLPLALCARGLLRHRLWTYRALSLLVWLYFTEGAVRASSESGAAQALAGAEIVLSLALFAVCAAYVRHRLRRARPIAS